LHARAANSESVKTTGASFFQIGLFFIGTSPPLYWAAFFLKASFDAVN
jgi:hypothetical protein